MKQQVHILSRKVVKRLTEKFDILKLFNFSKEKLFLRTHFPCKLKLNEAGAFCVLDLSVVFDRCGSMQV